MKTIEWLCSVPARNLQDLESSNLASVRLRTAVGIKAALGLGIKNVLSDGRDSGPAQLAVVGKIDCVTDPGRSARWLQRLFVRRFGVDEQVAVVVRRWIMALAMALALASVYSPWLAVPLGLAHLSVPQAMTALAFGVGSMVAAWLCLTWLRYDQSFKGAKHG